MNVTDLLVKNIEEMRGDIKDIKAKVDDLFAFKWKVLGMAMLFSFFMSIFGSFLFKKVILNEGKAALVKVESECGNGMDHC